MRDSLEIKKYRTGHGKNRAVVHLRQGFFKSRDKNSPKNVHVVRRIDRENNLYVEKVLDLSTNPPRVLVDKQEPLDQHTGHGEAH